MLSTTLSAVSDDAGPRPLNFRRDLKQVAALIEEAFGPELDAAGWAALRELRMAARVGPLLALFTPPDARPHEMLDGFVWEEQGQVIGNVTVQRVPQFHGRYLIANVAVAPAHRGRGIASELMRIALEHIARQGGQWAILQVRENNDIARGMYQRLGFNEIMQEHRLRCAQPPGPPPLPLPHSATLRPLSEGDWPVVRHLITHSLPEEARWWHPSRSSFFRSGSSPAWQRALTRWLGVGHKMRWGLFLADTLMGVLDVDVLAYNEHKIDLLLHPDLRADWTAPLLAHGLRYLQRQPARPLNTVLFDYQARAIRTLQDWGCEPFITLVNMRKRITSY